MIDKHGKPFVQFDIAPETITVDKDVKIQGKTVGTRKMAKVIEHPPVIEYDLAKLGWHKRIENFAKLVYRHGVTDVENLELGLFLYVETWLVDAKTMPCYRCGTAKYVYLKDVSIATELRKRCFKCDKTDAIPVNNGTAKRISRKRVSKQEAIALFNAGKINYIPKNIQSDLGLRKKSVEVHELKL
jgi:hypothetical protein